MRLSYLAAGTAILGSLLLTACGGSSGGGSASNPPPASQDSFVQTVRQYTDGANASSDTAEANDITNVMVTAPDNSEPENITF